MHELIYLEISFCIKMIYSSKMYSLINISLSCSLFLTKMTWHHVLSYLYMWFLVYRNINLFFAMNYMNYHNYIWFSSYVLSLCQSCLLILLLLFLRNTLLNESDIVDFYIRFMSPAITWLVHYVVLLLSVISMSGIEWSFWNKNFDLIFEESVWGFKHFVRIVLK